VRWPASSRSSPGGQQRVRREEGRWLAGGASYGDGVFG
jgi:hypothetical protein